MIQLAKRPSGSQLAINLSPATKTIIDELRFHLLRETSGEYRFTQVHLETTQAPSARAQFLVDLMNNRTIREVLRDLHPEQGADSRTARELRRFFQELLEVLNRPVLPPAAERVN